MIVLAACGGGGSEQPIAPPPPKASVAADLLRLYDYDAAAPLDVKETKTEQKDGATVHDITYAGPKGRIDAYLMIPDGDGPFPAVLFMPGAPGARFTFYTESLELAKRGIASLLPDPPYARPPIEDVVNFTPADKEGIVQEVVEMRRGSTCSFRGTRSIRAGLATWASAGAARSGQSSRRSSAGCDLSSSCHSFRD